MNNHSVTSHHLIASIYSPRVFRHGSVFGLRLPRYVVDQETYEP